MVGGLQSGALASLHLADVVPARRPGRPAARPRPGRCAACASLLAVHGVTRAGRRAMATAACSLNQSTTKRWPLAEAVDGCVRARHPGDRPVARAGRRARARRGGRARDATPGLRVSSLCRGGFFTARRRRRAALEDNRRAIDEAAALGAGLPGAGRRRAARPGPGTCAGARQRVADALAELAPYAGDAGVRLALEPLHPMYCADRAVLSHARPGARPRRAASRPSRSASSSTPSTSGGTPTSSAQIARAGGRDRQLPGLRLARPAARRRAARPRP